MNIFTIFQSKQFSGILTISRMREKRWTNAVQADLPRAGYGGLRVINQQLWRCCGDAGIVVFDSELQLQRTIPAADVHVELVIDVNAFDQSNKDVVIAASNGLYHNSKG